MSSTRFTPGPWEAEGIRLENDPDTVLIWIGDRNNDTGFSGICDLYHKGDNGEFCEKRNAKANAALIAAAPDLYAALEPIIELLKLRFVPEGFEYTVTQAEAALAKARGESSK